MRGLSSARRRPPANRRGVRLPRKAYIVRSRYTYTNTSGPLAPPPDGRGGAAWRSRPRGPAVGLGIALFPRPPLPRVGPSCRPSLGPLVPPAVVTRRWLAGGGREG